MVFPQWNRLFEIDGVYVFNLPSFHPDEKTLGGISGRPRRLWIISDRGGPNRITRNDSRLIRASLANRAPASERADRTLLLDHTRIAKAPTAH
jgi:hypothetical protein